MFDGLGAGSQSVEVILCLQLLNFTPPAMTLLDILPPGAITLKVNLTLTTGQWIILLQSPESPLHGWRIHERLVLHHNILACHLIPLTVDPHIRSYSWLSVARSSLRLGPHLAPLLLVQSSGAQRSHLVMDSVSSTPGSSSLHPRFSGSNNLGSGNKLTRDHEIISRQTYSLTPLHCSKEGLPQVSTINRSQSSKCFYATPLNLDGHRGSHPPPSAITCLVDSTGLDWRALACSSPQEFSLIPYLSNTSSNNFVQCNSLRAQNYTKYFL